MSAYTLGDVKGVKYWYAALIIYAYIAAPILDPTLITTPLK